MQYGRSHLPGADSRLSRAPSVYGFVNSDGEHAVSGVGRVFLAHASWPLLDLDAEMRVAMTASK
jgi:hypothetical protein